MDKMMTPSRLLRRRLRENAAFQYRSLRIAVDWTVALYLVVPLLFFAVKIYLDWWKEIPVWIEKLPLTFIAALVFQPVWMGTLRLFVEPADQLLLMRNKVWLPHLRRGGLMYSFTLQMVASLFMAGVLAPFLIGHYGYDGAGVVLFGLFTASITFVLALIRNRLRYRMAFWPKLGASVLIYAAAGCVYSFIVSWLLVHQPLWCFPLLLAVIAAGLRLAGLRIRQEGTFLEDVQAEGEIRMRLAALLLAQFTDRKVRRPRRKPLLFRHSQMLFRHRTPVNGLAEMGIKSFLRSRTHVQMYAQLTFIGLFVLWVLPRMIVWIVWPLLGLSMAFWLSLFWRDLAGSAFMKLFRWKEADLTEASKKMVFWLMLPGFLLLSIAAGFSALTVSGMLLTVAAGVLLQYVIVAVIMLFSSLSGKRG
ncbi:ABC transporter permease [Paenibacillus gansuensis]|uniref:ABC transporter permease n=1 Tax=Paenibacillus gansuensis TaxID=306542 RepID=A0ABW5PJL1_9BACL